MAFTNDMDSVFDQCSDDELDFDVMFDEDDRLVDIVEGFNEDGTSRVGGEFEDFHLSDDEPGDLDSTDDLDDKTTIKDMKDALEDKDNISGNKVENGSEQEIGDNDDNEKAGVPSSDEDAKYQTNDFSKGTVDPEKINTAIAAQEASAFLESEDEFDMEASDDVAGKTSDELDIEVENDPEERKDKTSEDDGVGEYEGSSDVEPKREASAYLESDDDLNDAEDDFDSSLDESDEVEDNPMAPESLDDFDLPNDTDEEQITANDIATEASLEPKFKLALEDDDMEIPKDDDTQGANVSQGSEVSEASAYLECDDEGIIADNSEAEAHKEVQCDGSSSCKCPACTAKREADPSFELAVGDLAEAAGADADVEEIVNDELSDPDLGDLADEVEDDMDSDYDYDPASDEEIIDYVINAEDEDEI